MKCWCDEVREKETEAIRKNGGTWESEYECWECRDMKIENKLIDNGHFASLAIHRGIDDFNDFNRVMTKALQEGK